MTFEIELALDCVWKIDSMICDPHGRRYRWPLLGASVFVAKADDGHVGIVDVFLDSWRFGILCSADESLARSG